MTGQKKQEKVMTEAEFAVAVNAALAAPCTHHKTFAWDCYGCTASTLWPIFHEAIEAELDACAAIANAEAQSSAVARDRAKAAGRKLVAECRQADLEMAVRIHDQIRARSEEPK